MLFITREEGKALFSNPFFTSTFLFPSFPTLFSPLTRRDRPKDRDPILNFPNYPVLPDQPIRIPPFLARLLLLSLSRSLSPSLSSSFSISLVLAPSNRLPLCCSFKSPHLLSLFPHPLPSPSPLPTFFFLPSSSNTNRLLVLSLSGSLAAPFYPPALASKTSSTLLFAFRS